MNSRIYISRSILFAVIVSGGYLIHGISRKLRCKNDLQQSLRTLPAFHFTALDNTGVTTDYIRADQPAVLLFFSPDCEYCQAQAQSIAPYLAKPCNMQLLWITDDSIKAVQAFAERYALDRPPKSKVVIAASGQIKNFFGISQLPAVLIYDQHHRLVRQFRGETKWEAIFTALNEQVNISD